MEEFTRTDQKAIVAIAILIERRANKQIITYSELGKKVGLPQYGLSTLLYDVFAWCERQGKRRSLALLVVTNHGTPAEGCFIFPEGHPDPTTKENYEQHRLELWQDDAAWADVEFPSDPAAIRQAYLAVWGRKPQPPKAA